MTCLFAIQLLYVDCEVLTLGTKQSLPGVDLETRGGMWKHDPFEELNTHIPGHLVTRQDVCNGNFSVVTRTEWDGRPSKTIEYMGTPTSILFIHHSAGSECFSLARCSREVRNIQDYHMIQKGWDDIGYNFVIGGDGRAYEGRGWDRVGAHTLGWNNISVSFGVMGDYTDHLPTKAALQAISDLMYRGVALRKLTPDFKLYGHRDARPMFKSPGEKLYQLIRTWSHYDPNTPRKPMTDAKK